MAIRTTIRTTFRLGPLVVAAALAACGTTTREGAVGVDRQQLLIVSTEEMNQGAALAYQQILKEEAGKGAVNRDPQQVERVRRIASRIIPHTGIFRPEAPKWAWEVNVISSDQVNAWCMPGGKIAFYTGILEKLRLTDDEAAAIMGHEIAHALREHGRERASRQVATGIAVGLGAAVLGVGQAGSELANLAANATFNLPNSRTQETEADRIGVELAARAGYDPRAAISLWQKMAQLGGGGQSLQWLSTHPSNEARIGDLQVYTQRVLPLFEQARAGR